MTIYKEAFIKVCQGIFEYLLLLPLLLIIGINIVNEDQLWNWLIGLFVLFTVGVIFRMIFAKQKWWLFSLFSIVIGVSSAFIISESLLVMIILAMIHTLIIYRGMMYGGRTRDELLPLSFLWISGLGTYFVSYFVFRFIEVLNPYLNYITVFGIVLIVMTMFVSNSDHLKNTTLSKEKKPFISKAIKSQNRIFLGITIVIIALITNGQRIREGLWNAFRAVLIWIIELLSGSESGEVIVETPPQPPREMELPFGEIKEPSVIAKFFEVAAIYIMTVVIVIAAIVLVLFLIKKTRVWMINGFRLIIQFLKRIMNQMTERDKSTQYVEEKESVFDWQEWKEEQQSKAKGLINNIFKRKPSWNSLSNQEKVRFVFRNFILQELDPTKFRNNATPREILEKLKLTVQVDDKQIEQLRIAYEQTRYGEQDIEEQIIQNIYALIAKK